MNIYNEDFLKKEFEDNFNVIVANPPYNQMIDMKFLQKSYAICDKVLFVHPSTWLIDEKGKQKKFTTTKELVKDHLDSIELFNGNGVFGISLFVPCVITYIDKNKASKGIHCIDRINGVEITYIDINDINKFSNTDVYFQLKDKIKNIVKEKGNLFDRLREQEESNFYVNLAQISGNHISGVSANFNSQMVKNDFYILCKKDLKVQDAPRKQRELTQFSFETELEADNFLNYVKTNFARFCLSILKNNGNLHRGELALIPWLDFTQEWTDEKLYQEFSITQKEIEFINKFIPKYY